MSTAQTRRAVSLPRFQTFPVADSRTMTDRRTFLRTPSLALPAIALADTTFAKSPAVGGPRVVSTWDFGLGANRAAWTVLGNGGSALDAVEAGARWVESDLCNPTVGHCGNPDRDGV